MRWYEAKLSRIETITTRNICTLKVAINSVSAWEIFWCDWLITQWYSKKIGTGALNNFIGAMTRWVLTLIPKDVQPSLFCASLCQENVHVPWIFLFHLSLKTWEGLHFTASISPNFPGLPTSTNTSEKSEPSTLELWNSFIWNQLQNAQRSI